MSSSTKRIQQKRAKRARAHQRLRNRVQGTSERPRLAVYKSLRYVYAQVIDDQSGQTIAQANSKEESVRDAIESSTATVDAAKLVGELIGERAKEKGVEAVVFDRGGFIYHGRVKAVADGARSKGLHF